MTYDEEFLTYWAEVYEARPELAARGVTFARFLTAPADILDALKSGRSLPIAPPLFDASTIDGRQLA